MSMEGYEVESAPALGQSAVIPPLKVKAVKRLADDTRVLTMLTSLEVPPLRRLIGSSKLKVLYGFGDSSRNGFGWSIDFGEEIRFEHGLWYETVCEEHSNYKELRNLVNALMRAGLEGRLTGREVFLYTDNQVAEGSYYRGTAASQYLFELVVELYILQMKYGIILHVI
jgi:elongation factor P--beta-lysine ligase